MKARFAALLGLSAASIVHVADVRAEQVSSTAGSSYLAKVDPGAFREVPHEHLKAGATVSPSAVRMITPGVDKFSIYRLIGPPHFGEGITRRWNYVLFFPAAPGSTERVRCRMEIRFVRPHGRYNVVVSEVVWQDQSCADRVARAS
jgi:outer membrane protein assembly factor BamE (lipoprotein component of BamABCDE complex)